MEIEVHIFLTSTPEDGDYSASRPSHLTADERVPGVGWTEGWVDPRAGPNAREEAFLTLPRIGPQFFTSPACSLTMNKCSLIVTLFYTDS